MNATKPILWMSEKIKTLETELATMTTERNVAVANAGIRREPRMIIIFSTLEFDWVPPGSLGGWEKLITIGWLCWVANWTLEKNETNHL